MKSGSAFEALAVSVIDFSVAPCVQHLEASEATIVSCTRLHETAIAVALRGPLPELLGVIHKGFPLKVRTFSVVCVARVGFVLLWWCVVWLCGGVALFFSRWWVRGWSLFFSIGFCRGVPVFPQKSQGFVLGN